MVIAVTVVGVVQVATRPVVDMRAMRHGGVAAARAVRVRLGMDAAFVVRRAGLRVTVRDQKDVVVHVVAVLVVQVAVVQVVLVPVVQDLVMAAAVRVMVRVAVMVFAVVHGCPPSIGLFAR